MMTGKEMINYLNEHEGWFVSPIWDKEKAFPFLTMPHVAFCEAMGFESYQATNILKMIKSDSVRDEEHLDEIIEKRYFDYSYFDEELRQLEELKKTEGFIGGGCFGPLTVASDILGAERTLRLIAKNPEFVNKLIDYVTDFVVELAKLEVKHGAQFFWIAEPFPSLLRPKQFWRFSGQYLKKVYDSIEVPGFLHVCGKTLYHTRYMEQTGAQVLSIDYLTDIKECIRMVSENTIIMGNVSPATLLLESDAVIEKEILDILDGCKNYKNLIVSTGCAMMRGTPEKNMRKLFTLTEQYPTRSNEEFRKIREMIKLINENRDIQEYVNENNIPDELLEAAVEEQRLIQKYRKSSGA